MPFIKEVPFFLYEWKILPYCGVNFSFKLKTSINQWKICLLTWYRSCIYRHIPRTCKFISTNRSGIVKINPINLNIYFIEDDNKRSLLNLFRIFTSRHLNKLSIVDEVSIFNQG